MIKYICLHHMYVHVHNVKLYNHMYVLMYNNTYNIYPLEMKLNGDNTNLICNKNLLSHCTLCRYSIY